MLRGVGEQLIKTLIEYGFDSLNLNKLVCEVYADNLQAINLYKRVKFQEIDRKITNNQEVICMELNNENR
jgi:RimJ/RimL family protein N-acetyltransferase